MQLKPLPNYFIVKINIQKQLERKEKVGSLYVHHAHAHMQRNMQNGEIIAIGTEAAKNFPEAKIGHTLIFHHFVEGSEREKSSIIYWDNEFNYYNVTAKEFNGHRNESYAVFDGKKITPHSDFIFLNTTLKEKEISADDFIEQNTKQIGSLLLFTNWTESRESKEEKSQTIMNEIKNMSKGKELKDDVKIGLEEKEKEAAKITASLSSKQYTPFSVAFYNSKMKVKEKVYCLNMAANLELEFMDKKYIIVQSKYVSATA